MNYYDHNAKRTSWEVIDWPAMSVAERPMSPEEWERFQPVDTVPRRTMPELEYGSKADSKVGE